MEEKSMLKEVRNALNELINKDLDYNDTMYLLDGSIPSLEYIKARLNS